MSVIIWHNPRCSKSRQTLALLEEKDINPTIRLYLEDAPSTDEIKDVLLRLSISAHQLVRRGEDTYKACGLSKDTSDDALIVAMAANPILIERPIVITNNMARIGRPPEGVLELF